MTGLIITTILAYAVLTIILGLLANRMSKNSSQDYFIADRSVGSFHLSFTYIATFFSTFAFLGTPGFVQQNGISWMIGILVFNTVAPLLLWLIGRYIWETGKKYGHITAGDFFEHHFNSKTLKIIVGFVAIISLVPYVQIQLIAIGKVMSVSTDGVIPYWGGVVAAGTIGATYTFIGGVRAIIWTDVIQLSLFLTVVAIALYIVLSISPDGFAGSLAIVADQNPELFTIEDEKIGWIITMILIWAFGYILFPHMWQRIYLAKSAGTIAKSMFINSTVAFFLITSLIILGLLSTNLTEISDSDKLIPAIFAEYAPYAVPLVVLAVFAAGMSTMDSQLLTSASVFIKDIMEPITGKKISEKAEKKIGRYTVATMVVLVTILALIPDMQKSIILLASKGAAVAFLLLVPLLLALFGNRSAFIAIGALVVGIIIMLVIEIGGIELAYGFGAAIASFVGQAVFVIISIFFQRILSFINS